MPQDFNSRLYAVFLDVLNQMSDEELYTLIDQLGVLPFHEKMAENPDIFAVPDIEWANLIRPWSAVEYATANNKSRWAIFDNGKRFMVAVGIAKTLYSASQRVNRSTLKDFIRLVEFSPQTMILLWTRLAERNGLLDSDDLVSLVSEYL